MSEPLWRRALLARETEKAKARSVRAKAAGKSGGRHNRRHPKLAVGDRLGGSVVTALMPPDAASNERVMARCRCGHESPVLAFNLRKRSGRCAHRGCRAVEDVENDAARRIAEWLESECEGDTSELVAGVREGAWRR